MFKTTKPKLNMKFAKFINKIKEKKQEIKQKIKQKKENKNHANLDLKEIKIMERKNQVEFEDEFGDLESMSFEEDEYSIIPIYEIGECESDEELGCNLQ